MSDWYLKQFPWFYPPAYQKQWFFSSPPLKNNSWQLESPQLSCITFSAPSRHPKSEFPEHVSPKSFQAGLPYSVVLAATENLWLELWWSLSSAINQRNILLPPGKKKSKKLKIEGIACKVWKILWLGKQAWTFKESPPYLYDNTPPFWPGKDNKDRMNLVTSYWLRGVYSHFTKQVKSFHARKTKPISAS